MSSLQYKVSVVILAFVLSFIELFHLVSVPSSKELEYQGELRLTPTTLVTSTTFNRTIGKFRQKYYIRYENETHSVLVKTKKSLANATIYLKEKEDFALYTSNKKSSTYRLVESGITLEESLKEERKPFLIMGSVYFALGIYFAYKTYISEFWPR